MIRIAEYLLVRFQDRVGIPKWRLQLTAWCAASVLAVVGALMYGRNVVPRVLISVLVVIISSIASVDDRRDQERADKVLMVVPNPRRDSAFWKLLRCVIVPCFLIGLIPPIRAVDLVQDCLTLTAMILVACDTFPMVGPSLKDRIKTLFTMRRTKTATNEA